MEHKILQSENKKSSERDIQIKTDCATTKEITRIGTEFNDTTDEATEALVFMVVPINNKGKLPLAYYLTNKHSGEEKAEILKSLLRAVGNWS